MYQIERYKIIIMDIRYISNIVYGFRVGIVNNEKKNVFQSTLWRFNFKTITYMAEMNITYSI